MKTNLFAAVAIIFLSLTSCSESCTIEEKNNKNMVVTTNTYGIVERSTRIINSRANSSQSATVVYLTNGTIISNTDQEEKYIAKKFSMVEKGDTVFYTSENKVADVRYRK